MTVLEVMVVLAIALALVAVTAPAIGALLQLEQRRAARDLALVYQRLHDEAVLRNMTFRIAYHLDGNYYLVEAGDPDSLIFSDPRDRIEAEEELQGNLKRFSEEEAAAAREDGFQTIVVGFQEKFELPHGTRFGSVWTPQYEEPVQPSGEGEEDPEEPLVAYSYLFPNGYAEPTLVQLVEVDDPEEGYTIVVEPMSGRVQLSPELLDHRDLFQDAPEQGPTLPN